MARGALTKAEMAERLFDELGVNKREAKELVESAPAQVRDAVPREEADEIKGKLEEAGAVVELA